ncbi:MAG: DUF1361 domain-containing protein [Verrucomicrobiota bacterium]
MFKLLLKRETLAPVCALAFGSAVTVALVLVRIVWTDNLRHAFLIWNLFLAWLPLLFALLAAAEFNSDRQRSWRVFGWAGAWLLFFPNAPYICTDLIHLSSRFHGHFWVDLTLILLSAFTGLVLGFLSLYLMQSIVARRLGRSASWLFVMLAMGLSSFGVYLGRFLRFNSWDVVFRPGELYRVLDGWLESPVLHRGSAAFLVLFATFLFIAYVMLYALTHLSPGQPLATTLKSKEA